MQKSILSNSSYETYMKDRLQLMSNNFSLKPYKTAHQEEWCGFKRGKELRIQIQWKGECIWEWITEKAFWVQRNTNKEDRIYMRRHADVKLNACKNAIVKKTPTKKTVINTKPTTVGNTQDLFENMKKS
tara:strand:- start:84 stop:470 length:387 start_codon:yes stop_codon:yes gene_type:complete